MIEINGAIYMVGKYQAEVVSDVDPSHERRIKVRVFQIHDDDAPASSLPWARCCVPNVGNNTGDKPRPNIGQKILVSFEMGDPELPIWDGGFIEDEAPNGPKKERVDGRSDLEIKKDQSVSVGAHQSVSVANGQTINVGGVSRHTFEKVETIVVGEQTFTIGRRAATVKGSDNLSVGGDAIWRIVGNQTLQVAGSQSSSIGGTLRQLVLEQAIIKAMNAGGLPTSSAILLESINGGVQALARSLAGVEGASLNLDPLGALTSLKSLASLSIESPVVRIAPKKDLATVPVCTLPHTHLAFGVPTTPATPGPGTPVSILGPAL